jgi:hypothetical protein
MLYHRDVPCLVDLPASSKSDVVEEQIDRRGRADKEGAEDGDLPREVVSILG